MGGQAFLLVPKVLKPDKICSQSKSPRGLRARSKQGC